jgi:translation initiation factor IF-2
MKKPKKEKAKTKKAVAPKVKKASAKAVRHKPAAKAVTIAARKAAVKTVAVKRKAVTAKQPRPEVKKPSKAMLPRLAVRSQVPSAAIKSEAAVITKEPAIAPVKVQPLHPVTEARPLKREVPPAHLPIKKIVAPEVKKEEAAPALKKEVPVAPKEVPETKKEIPAVKKEIPPAKAEPKPHLKELEVKFPITLKDLSVRLQEKPSSLIKVLLDMRMMVGINQALEEETANIICEKFGFRIIRAPDEEELVLRSHQEADSPKDLKQRPPIVTLMGHVDHGKTSLLDAIRKSKVVDSEHGGITQHIGAYRVVLPTGEITFLDTPGHEAFTAMRARGASITDIVVLVVAADDGVMPQTQEAIDHARAAGVSIIVALNKIDKPQAEPDRVKKQLAGLNLTPEDWGGKTITVPVSAKTGQGIDLLLEMLLLEAQMLELKANSARLAKGVVVEARMTKGRGPVSTLLIQNGTLHLNDNIIVGRYYGKVRAMFNDHGHSVNEAPSSFPVEVLGISGIPDAGEQFFVVEDEKAAKEIALKRQEQARQSEVKAVKRISLEDLHAQIQEGKIKELKLILKADVQGSLAAISDTLNKLNVSEIKLDIIHEGVGNINTSDAILAVASNALILGFNVSADERAKELAAKEGVDIRTYNIIYELANDIKAAVEGMLEPKLKKTFLGRAEVRKVFKLSRSGTVAGCFVSKGKFTRTCEISLSRNGEVVFEGKLSSLKRFKDDVREVMEGFECGMALAGFDNLQEGDVIEAFEIEKIARKL